MRFAVSLALGFAVAAPAAADDPKAVVTPLAEAFLKGKKNTAVVVGVWHRGKPHAFGFGTAVTRTGGRTPDGRTVFEIGSITKAFTGVLLAEAVRRGEVELDDPAQQHLPPDLVLPKPGGEPITLLHLATHRSALPVEPPFIGLFARDPANPYADFDRAKLAAILGKLKLETKPGTEYHYSNLGAGLLGIALVHAAEADGYDALVRERVCKPLGMTNTGEALTGAQLSRLAKGHDGEMKPASPWDFATLEACGGLRSTADDMLRFAAANLGETKTDLLPALVDSHRPRAKDGKHLSIGLCWHRMKLDTGADCVWHNGGTGGYRSMLALVPEKKMACVALCSAAHDEAVDELALDVLNRLFKKGVTR